MTPISDELRSFMMDTVRIAKVSTSRKNSDPWVQPVWFTLDSDEMVFVISKRSLLGRAVRRESALAVCVDDTEVPYTFAVLEGDVTVIDDLALASQWMEVLLRRYRTDVTDVPGHARMLSEDYGFTLVRMPVDRIYFEPTVSPAPAESAAPSNDIDAGRADR